VVVVEHKERQSEIVKLWEKRFTTNFPEAAQLKTDEKWPHVEAVLRIFPKGDRFGSLTVHYKAGMGILDKFVMECNANLGLRSILGIKSFGTGIRWGPGFSTSRNTLEVVEARALCAPKWRPELADVVWSLISDTNDSPSGMNFKDFCELGTTEGMKPWEALDVYNKLVEHDRFIRRYMPAEELSVLQELCQDY
jgi:hypothetical protein